MADTIAQPAEPEAAKNKRLRPTKTLPTERIAFPKQLDLLRAYAAASAPGGRPVTNADVADIVKMTASTVSMANAFFSDSGLLIRNADGGYVPSSDVTSYQLAYAWNPETASHKIAPVISETWFAKALLARLTFGPMEEAEAIEKLADAATAGPEYKGQLRVCVEYLIASGLVQRDGNMLKIGRTQATSQVPPEKLVSTQEQATAVRSAAVATTFAAPTEGVVQFHVSVRVDMKEFAGWQPDRIASFFSGIAAVLSAKGAIEKEASG
jgi:hypothetical protein